MNRRANDDFGFWLGLANAIVIGALMWAPVVTPLIR